MRKVILLAIMAISFLLSSCITTNYHLSSTLVDYSEFSDKGFFITESSSVSFDYDAVGSISVLCRSGSYRDPRVTGTIEGAGKWKRANEKDMLIHVYDKAKEKNADGLINLKISYLKDKNQNSPYAYVLTGMLIKRKK